MIGARAKPFAAPRRSIAGVTLIELMVALVLGLIVAGAAMAVFITTRQTYLATESMGRLQESARVAFELMSREIREAATIPCSRQTELNNIVDSTAWWTARDAGVPVGALSQWNRTSFVDDAGALQLIAAVSPQAAPIVVTVAPPAPATLPLDLVVNSTNGLSAGDLLMVCDYGYFDPASGDKRAPSGAIFQASSVNSASGKIGIATGGSPGNEAGDLFRITSVPGSPQVNGIVTVLRPTRWYIGDNAAGGKSLFRTRLVNTAEVLAPVNDEIVANAERMGLTYLEDGAAGYVAAAAVTDWSKILAVRIELDLTSTDLVDGEPIKRTLEHVVTIRNRVL